MTPTKIALCPQLGTPHLFPPLRLLIRHTDLAVLPQMSSGSIPLLWDSQARLFAQLRVLEGQTFTSTEEAEGASAEGS